MDVSVTVRPTMPIYEGNPGVAIDRVQSIDRGDVANVSRLELGAHTGTHVDAPCHFISDGPGADEVALDPLIGPCIVADASGATGQLDRRLIDSLNLPPECDRVLLKTPNSRLWELDEFSSDFVRLTGSGAEALIERGVRAVGIDYLSIGDPDAHHALLERHIGVIEGLDLRGVDPGDYFIVCLPLKIAGSDGAPARTVLWSLAG